MFCDGGNRSSTDKSAACQRILQFCKGIIVSAVSVHDDEYGACAVSLHLAKPRYRAVGNASAVGGDSDDADVLCMK